MKIALFCLSICILLTGMKRVETTYNNEGAINREFTNMYAFGQGKSFQIYGSTPVASDVAQGQLIFISTGNYHAFCSKLTGSTNTLRCIEFNKSVITK